MLHNGGIDLDELFVPHLLVFEFLYGGQQARCINLLGYIPTQQASINYWKKTSNKLFDPNTSEQGNIDCDWVNDPLDFHLQ
ncbi:unnamed protein product [Dovyalis caffra]|uniref:Serine-threonine/tyrosine-protein kinase catalytic domain-containing protein n=1 Tax=Dovyalis caffra TaxID=77055 RepID=A0AAV1RJA8_9ROSI|nr:unnamed protein product [Dovyalis caffra]